MLPAPCPLHVFHGPVTFFKEGECEERILKSKIGNGSKAL
jgi:hypothetical protein